MAQEVGKVVSLTHRPPHFCYGPGRTQGYSAAGRIKSMKNGTRDLPAYSAVLQPTAPPRISSKLSRNFNTYKATEKNNFAISVHPAFLTMDTVYVPSSKVAQANV